MTTLMRLAAATALVLLLAACPVSQAPQPAAAGPAASGHAGDDPFRLSPYVVPVSQQLTLEIDPARPDYTGSTTIGIELRRAMPEIRLHAEEIDIATVELERRGRIVEVVYRSGEHGLLILDADDGFEQGAYTLHIDFANDFNTDGVGIHRNELDGRHYIFSQFEAVDAREAFPVFDEPGFKLRWQLTLRVPEGITAVTNTPAEEVVTADGWTTTAFMATPPLPSYLIAVAAGPLERVPIAGLSVPAGVVVPEGLTALTGSAVETTPPILAWLEDYFGEPYPFRKLDLVATVGAFSGAMEHPGAITYSDYILLADEQATLQQQTLVRVTAHELAHQWFGNLVTMQWWDDLWLNESFADWMADKTVAAVYPHLGVGTRELRTVFRIMDMDSTPATRPIRKEFAATDNFQDGIFLSYYKGKAVLGMFERAAGSEVFRNGVIRYLGRFRGGNARAADLWAAIDAGADFDLAGGLESFIAEPGIPLVAVTPLGDGRYEFAQSRFLVGDAAGPERPTWTIPVLYKSGDGNRVTSHRLILDEPAEVVELGAEVDWIMPNAEQRGYYRWTVPADMQARLGRDAAAMLTLRERMGMLANLWALLTGGIIDGDEYLESLAGFAADGDADVIAALIDQLGNILVTFVTPDLREEFARWVSTVLGPAYERIGPRAGPGDDPATAALRPRLMAWLANRGGDPAARADAAELARQYLDGEQAMNDLVATALQTSAADGDLAYFDRLRERFEAEKLPTARLELLAALGSFHDPAIVDEALAYALRGPLRRNDITTLISVIGSRPENRDRLLDWLIANDAGLRERVSDEAIAYIPGFIAACSPERLERIEAFYDAPERAVPGIGQAIAETRIEARTCAAIRAREIGAIRHYLENLR